MTEFYIMTGTPQELERDAGDKSHLKAVLTKPFGPAKLYEALEADKKTGKPKTMVVDDDTMLGPFVKKLLSIKGWDVHLYDNPEDALIAYPSVGPDIVLSDYFVGNITGLEMTRKMSEYDKE